MNRQDAKDAKNHGLSDNFRLGDLGVLAVRLVVLEILRARSRGLMAKRNPRLRYFASGGRGTQYYTPISEIRGNSRKPTSMLCSLRFATGKRIVDGSRTAVVHSRLSF